jgi:CBS-domain-containing membrane protein
MAAAERSGWIACVLAAGGVAAMSVAAWVTGLPAVVPSLAPSLLGAAASPGRREHTPTTLLVGHFIAILAALASLVAFDLLGEPPALVAGVSAARMVALPVALALTLAGMLIVRRLHPAAGATALLVGMGIVRPGGDLVVLIAAIAWTAAIVALFPWAAARLGERTAPRPKATRGVPRRRAARARA